MFQQYLDSNRNKDDSTDYFGAFSNQAAQFSSKQESKCCNHKTDKNH